MRNSTSLQKHLLFSLWLPLVSISWPRPLESFRQTALSTVLKGNTSKWSTPWAQTWSHLPSGTKDRVYRVSIRTELSNDFTGPENRLPGLRQLGPGTGRLQANSPEPWRDHWGSQPRGGSKERSSVLFLDALAQSNRTCQPDYNCSNTGLTSIIQFYGP
jgi:hypothetical protein